jgi:secreted PhoX family phosphatase
MKNTYSKSGAIAVFLFLSHIGNAQTIGTFNSVQPSAQTQNLRLPSSHTFQRIIGSGDALSSGGTLGNQLDFTGYVPIASSSADGFLSINSEPHQLNALFFQ